ncbi:FadR/GntR family transcriptional regulator [Paeniglutamicibacter psychrophenolicus]|uniref:FadR/GntR family transcriptional regulator n=1 Tax=Paeniglutamicibacter psychrophenolicus TaxID=257454 RepID=UPI00278751E4|nr:FCD domain-containing protein [Paeniglutamicibacter psychrophenolicus]MDQ0094281.1 DNA-binding FadR family transcriptional regulator [Paeniglutamicibacter psychrophenolicus]
MIVSRPPRLDAHARLRALTSDITDLILDRGLLPGDAMPTEQELMAELGVGRNTLREAIKVLQALGVVEIRHGFGMFVAEENLVALSDSLTFRGQMSLRHKGHEANELVDVRQALEAGLVGTAMSAITEQHLAELEAIVVDMERLAADGHSFIDADRNFHRILFEPLNNQLLSNLLGVFWDVYRTIHQSIDAKDSTRAHLAETAHSHRELFEAVKSGDKPLASSLLACHFDGIRGQLAEFNAPAG